MLTDREQRVWDDIQRFSAETAKEPAAVRRRAASLRRQTRRKRGDDPVWVGILTWVAIFTALFGAVAVGLALGAITLLSWALWRYWPQLASPAAAVPTVLTAGETASAGKGTPGVAAPIWNSLLSRLWKDER